MSVAVVRLPVGLKTSLTDWPEIAFQRAPLERVLPLRKLDHDDAEWDTVGFGWNMAALGRVLYRAPPAGRNGRPLESWRTVIYTSRWSVSHSHWSARALLGAPLRCDMHHAERRTSAGGLKSFATAMQDTQIHTKLQLRTGRVVHAEGHLVSAV